MSRHHSHVSIYIGKPCAYSSCRWSLIFTHRWSLMFTRFSLTNEIATIFTVGIYHKYWYFDNVVQNGKVMGCVHVNFLSNLFSFKVNKYCDKLSGLRCSCVLWVCQNTMHLELLKNIKLKGENKRPLGIAHVVLFTFQSI